MSVPKERLKKSPAFISAPQGTDTLLLAHLLPLWAQLILQGSLEE